MLLLKTRCHAALLGLITHAYNLHIVHYNNVLKFVFKALNDFVIKLILYFIICELLGIPEIRKDAYLNNHSKTTHYTQNYLLNCFIVCLLYYSFEILPTKPQGCFSFSFAQVRGHSHFSNEICISWVPVRSSMVFFSCRIPEKLTRKAGLRVCGWSLRPIFNPEKKLTFELKLICI